MLELPVPSGGYVFGLNRCYLSLAGREMAGEITHRGETESPALGGHREGMRRSVQSGVHATAATQELIQLSFLFSLGYSAPTASGRYFVGPGVADSPR